MLQLECCSVILKLCNLCFIACSQFKLNRLFKYEKDGFEVSIQSFKKVLTVHDIHGQ